ncbi:MAG TPA: histidinol-phosphate transaminase [Candidatus Acidoferrales bacterium]|nr:histidinol-phosphate transaminase [Candidatus Acidoferrales bacterium]
MKRTIRARKAVERMRPYYPPLEGRFGKVRLDFNENPLGCSPAVRRALAKLGADAISMYPEQGSVRAKMAKALGVRTGELLLTNGTDEALHLLVQTFVDAGERVLLAEPTYAMYRFYAELAGARIETLRYGAASEIPMPAILAALRRRPRLFFLANPNSPTGHLASYAQLRRILKAAPRTIIVVDEAYHEFSDMTVLPWLRRYGNLVVTRTFSKAAGMAGLRLGCIFAQEGLAAQMRKAQSPYPVNVAALAAAEAALGDRAFIARTIRETRRGRAHLERGLARLGIRYFPSAGNFVLAQFGERAGEIVTALAKQRVLVRDRSSDFGGEGYVRITLGTTRQARRFLRELERILPRKPIPRTFR